MRWVVYNHWTGMGGIEWWNHKFSKKKRSRGHNSVPFKYLPSLVGDEGPTRLPETQRDCSCTSHLANCKLQSCQGSLSHRSEIYSLQLLTKLKLRLCIQCLVHIIAS